MPIIIEVLEDQGKVPLSEINEAPSNNENIVEDSKTGILWTDKTDNGTRSHENKEPDSEAVRIRRDLLEYMTRKDGRVICKLCGELLQSRTHWYRHKYKVHVNQPQNPAPLFQCDQCLLFFKSRKGYIGHIASRHSDLLSDASPVLSNSQAKAVPEEQPVQETKSEESPDPEAIIPKTSVLNYQTSGVKHASKLTENKKLNRVQNKDQDISLAEWDEVRLKEEKLVTAIIDRVRKECEAQGSGGSTRKGYVRRHTVMNT